MGTYKKKDFKKIKSEELKVKNVKIDELVDSDGGELDDTDDIDGNELSNSEIQTGPTLPYKEKGDPTTSQDHEKSAIQPRRFYGIDGTPYSHGATGVSSMYEDEDISEMQKDKMKSMVRELLRHRSDENGIVNKANSHDINNNRIPDYDELRPATANNLMGLIKAIDGSENEFKIVLNIIKKSM